MKITTVKRYLPVIAGIVCLGIFLGYRVTGHITENKARAKNLAQSSAVTVEVRTALPRMLRPTLTFSAGLEPAWIAEISAKVDGRILTADVGEGAWVDAGAVVMELENTDAQAQIMQAKGNLLAAQSNLEQAALDYNRYAALAADGAVAGQVLDNARTKYDAMKGQVQTSEGALALAQEKEANLSVKAPRSGVVTKRHLQEGAYVRSGTPLITIADTKTLLAKATIGEMQVADLAVGTSVNVVVDAVPGEVFSGVITMISPMAALPARTFDADISIDNSAGRLKAGMFATVEIPVAEAQTVIAVPESAIVLREDQPGVYVVKEDKTVSLRVIRTGAVDHGWIEVVKGLAEGEVFVDGGQNKLREGMTVSAVSRGEKA